MLSVFIGIFLLMFLTNCTTSKSVVSQGAYTTFGISPNADIKGALKRVGEQISKTFK